MACHQRNEITFSNHCHDSRFQCWAHSWYRHYCGLQNEDVLIFVCSCILQFNWSTSLRTCSRIRFSLGSCPFFIASGPSHCRYGTRKLWMGTLNDLKMKISNLMYLKSLEQMYSQLTSHAQLILLLLLELSFHFWPLLWKILRNTSRLRSKFWMTRMSGVDFEHQTFNLLQGWSHISAQCRWSLTMAGTTFSWISLIWQKGRMAQITSRRCGCKFMQTADFAEFTSLIASTQRRSCRLSSSSTFQSKNHRIQRAWRDFGHQETDNMPLWGSLSHNQAAHLPSWDPEKYQNVSVSFLFVVCWMIRLFCS